MTLEQLATFVITFVALFMLAVGYDKLLEVVTRRKVKVNWYRVPLIGWLLCVRNHGVYQQETPPHSDTIEEEKIR